MKVLAIVIALGAAACGSYPAGPADGGFPSGAYATATADDGTRVEVRTAPVQPPVRGTLSVQLDVRDPQGAPCDGLAVDVVPWMPTHAHGTSVDPVVSARGGGIYDVDDVDLFMSGSWQLRIALTGDAGTGHVVVPVSVQ